MSSFIRQVTKAHHEKLPKSSQLQRKTDGRPSVLSLRWGTTSWWWPAGYRRWRLGYQYTTVHKIPRGRMWCYLLPRPGRGTGYCNRAISLFVCLFVYLFLCQQHYEKTAGPICMKFFRATAYMLSAHMLSQFRPSVRPSVRLSVRLSHGWFMQKRL